MRYARNAFVVKHRSTGANLPPLAPHRRARIHPGVVFMKIMKVRLMVISESTVKSDKHADVSATVNDSYRSNADAFGANQEGSDNFQGKNQLARMTETQIQNKAIALNSQDCRGAPTTYLPP